MTIFDIDEKIEGLKAEYEAKGGNWDIYFRRIRFLEIVKEKILDNDPQTNIF